MLKELKEKFIKEPVLTISDLNKKNKSRSWYVITLEKAFILLDNTLNTFK